MKQLEDMRIFVEALDRGSFSAAAKRLGMSKQLVSRRIMELEARLGVRLLVRTTRNLTPTELGEDYADRTRRILADVQEANEAMANHVATPRGTLRVTAPLSFGIFQLAPVLTGFLTLHPGVKIDLDLTDRQVDLVAEGFDVAVRIGILDDSSLKAKRLFGVRGVVCASPDYLRRFGTPKTVHDLKSHNCLTYRHSRGIYWFLFLKGKVESIPVNGSYSANNGDVLREAAVGGLGLIQLPTFIVQPELDAGRLVTVLDDLMPPEGAGYAVYAPHRQRSALVRAFIEYLSAALA